MAIASEEKIRLSTIAIASGQLNTSQTPPWAYSHSHHLSVFCALAVTSYQRPYVQYKVFVHT